MFCLSPQLCRLCRSFFFAVAVSVLINSYSLAGEAEDIFIDACLNSGYNPKLFSTGQAVFHQTWQQDAEAWKDMLARSLARIEKQIRENHTGTEEELQKKVEEESVMDRAMYGTRVEKSRIECLMKGTYFCLTSNIKNIDPVWFRQRLYTQSFETTNEQMPTGLSIPKQRRTLVHSDVKSPQSFLAAVEEGAVISIGTVTPAAEFQLFGRVQGYWAEMAIDTLLAGSNYSKFSFSQSGRRAFADECRKQKIMFIKNKESEYDGGHKAQVIDVVKNGNLLMQYWIDTSRGYICPFIRQYNDNGSIFKEFLSAEYEVHQPTGLWYPKKYEESTFQNGALMVKYAFVLETGTLQINKPVADAMFVLDVRQGMNVWDNRNGHNGQYRASAAGQLSFKGGKFDIDDADWMNEDEAMYREEPVPVEQSMLLLRIVLIATGALMIITPLFLICRKYAKRASHKRNDDEK